MSPERLNQDYNRPHITENLSPRRLGAGASLPPEIWSSDQRERLPVDDPTRIEAEKNGGFRKTGTQESVDELDALIGVARELLEIS